MLGAGGQSDLEKIALPTRGLSKLPWRHAGSPMKRAHEVRQVAETRVEGDLGDRPVTVGELPCRTAQARAHEVLMRGHAEDLVEYAQEVERTQSRSVGKLVEAQALAGAQATVKDIGGGNHWSAVVVAPAFEGKTLVERHQMVYATVRDKMLPADESKPWMKYAGMIETGDPEASRKIDDVVYGQKD